MTPLESVLVRDQEIVGREVVAQSAVNKFFNDFSKNWNKCDGSVIVDYGFVTFFKNRTNY